MLFARTTTRSGDDVLVIGLSKENRKRLDAGQPLDITTYTPSNAVPGELHLVIFGGVDEDTMQDDLKRFLGYDPGLPAGKPRGAAE